MLPLNDRQKALSHKLFAAMEYHLADWPATTFEEALSVLERMLNALEVQKLTAGRSTIMRQSQQ